MQTIDSSEDLSTNTRHLKTLEHHTANQSVIVYMYVYASETGEDPECEDAKRVSSSPCIP